MAFYRRRSWVFLVLVVLIVIIILKLDTGWDTESVKSDVDYADDTDISQNRLFDLENFRINIEPSVCSDQGRSLLGIIIVTSYVGHDDVRAAHRKGVSQRELQEMGLARVFLIAQIPPTERYVAIPSTLCNLTNFPSILSRFITQSSVASEHRRFGDLLQGDFIENYRNLTYKHVMGLRWAALACSHAKYIIKIDDDSVYDIYRVQEYLKKHQEENEKRQFLAGYIFNHQPPIRLQADKHYVTQEEFPGEEFPKYLSGWLYLTNPRTARQLIKESLRKKFFWIDDTYVTGILAQDLSIEFVDLTWWFSANPDFLDCCVRDLKRHNLTCEFLIGPNGGDTKLLPLYQLEAKKCFQTDVCQERKGSAQNIRNTCVTEYKDLLRNDHGSAIVRPIKL